MANKVVQLVDKNSNNLYPIAGSVITDAVSTTAISNQAVTNPKIENGAVNGVANDATAIGTAKLALDTVGTPNLRDASVTSDKIDFTTFTSAISLDNQNTFEVPAGKWFVFCKCSVGQTAANEYWVAVCRATGLDTQTQTCAGPQVPSGIYSQQSWGNMFFFGMVEPTAATTLTLEFSTQRNCSMRSIRWLAIPYLK